MTGNLISMAAEALVAVLLVITIAYCMVLNSRLKRLRADESDLRATISELVSATEIAERAIGGLKVAALECDKTLSTRIREAEYFSIEITREIGEGQKVLARIKQIAVAVRRSDAQTAAEQQAAQDTTEAAPKAAPPVSLSPADLKRSDVRGADAKAEVRVGSSVTTAPVVVRVDGGDDAVPTTQVAPPALPAMASVPVAVVEDVTRSGIVPPLSKSGSRIEELRQMAEQARERLKEMRRVNAEKAA